MDLNFLNFLLMSFYWKKAVFFLGTRQGMTFEKPYRQKILNNLTLKNRLVNFRNCNHNHHKLQKFAKSSSSSNLPQPLIQTNPLNLMVFLPLFKENVLPNWLQF